MIDSLRTESALILIAIGLIIVLWVVVYLDIDKRASGGGFRS